MRATAAMPYVSKIVEYEGKKYLDGGVADSIPVEKCIAMGCDKVIVVLTRPVEYRKGKSNPRLANLMYRKKYPKAAERINSRPDEYNACVEKIIDMEKRGEGSIVNISSISATTYLPNNLLYNIAKAGVNTTTKTLARALGPDGIRVNAVGPGSTPTDLNAALYADPEVERALCARLPLGRRARKDDIANAVLFLASDAADYVTGQVLYVEGGWLTL